ncbi:unnamed protein product [Acanthoscelides obtectus]|uniref:Uncharacterized protein n=1 Tax=Acanthoscelides obtectus TaxID=200917 RepID=A0A9P0NVD2_ACAOB|nr:unnamed protein product [Acanthoscelides obtectus]CAK1627976.1 hypothetical protein AOBTE_LOCUS4935 [Acanthoscelides obtectus]
MQSSRFATVCCWTSYVALSRVRSLDGIRVE